VDVVTTPPRAKNVGLQCFKCITNVPGAYRSCRGRKRVEDVGAVSCNGMSKWESLTLIGKAERIVKLLL
jgi:hypothetical protein